MLKTMRSNLKSLSWTLWLVILAFIGFIFVQWGSGRFEQEGLDRDVAAVGRYTVSGEDFQKGLAQALERYDQQFKNSLNRQTINQLGIAEQVLQGMISAFVIQGEAEKLGLKVSAAELQDAIRSYPAFQREGKFIGSEEYERLLAYNHMTVRDFEEGLRKDLLADKLKELVTAGQVLDADTLREDYRQENDQAELDYILFRTADVKETPVIPESELRDFYQKHPDRFRSAEKRAGEVLALKFADFKKEVTLKEDELYAYFRQNTAMFKVPGKTRISRIWVAYDAQSRDAVLKRMEEAAAGLTAAAFPAKAREMSGDEKAKEGGDWGYFAWQNFSAQEKSMIDNLEQGEVSSPVDTGEGFALLLAAEKVPEQQEAYDAVKARIRSVLESDRLKKLAGERIAQAYESIKKKGSLREGAGKLAAKVVESGLLTQGQPIQGVDDMGYVSQRLFSLGESEISQPLEFPDGFAVVRLTRIVKPETEPFATAREKVLTEAQEARKLEQQLARARQVAAELSRLADAKKAEAFLKQEGLKTESATYRRGNRLADLPEAPGLDDAVFALGEGAYSAALDLEAAAAIIKLKSKKVVVDADFAKEREAYYRKKLAEAKNSRFGSFLQGRRDAYKVRFNAEVFERIKEYVTSRFR